MTRHSRGAGPLRGRPDDTFSGIFVLFFAVLQFFNRPICKSILKNARRASSKMAPNALHVAVLAACGLPIDQSDAYVPSLSAAFQRTAANRAATALKSTPTANGDTASSSSASSSSADDAFSAFAESLDEDTLFDDEDVDSFGNNGDAALPTWQESLDSLLDPTTPAAKRQILLSDLLNASDDIRESVQDALANRKVRHSCSEV